MNWMCYVRGHPADYNGWSALGNDGWSYNDVLPYFNKAETMETDELRNFPNHGHEGPLHISKGLLSEPCRQAKEAGKEIGMKTITDSDGHETDGIAEFQLSVHNGARQSVVSAYLRPSMGRKNLHVMTNARVTKILFSNVNGQPTANGVKYQHLGKIHSISANKEVILSAGAVKSPQILMLSGIGPADHLQEHNIHVVLDSPAVGKNLDDHLFISLTYSINITENFDYDHFFSISNIVKYLPQYILRGLTGYLHSHFADVNGSPDLQFSISPGDSTPHRVHFFNHEAELEKYFEPVQSGRTGITLLSILLHPHSLGNIRLKSNNPLTIHLLIHST